MPRHLSTAEKIKRGALFLYRYILEALFPTHCIGCGAPEKRLCSRCAEKLPRAETPRVAHTVAIFSYGHDTVSRMIHRLKYGGETRIAELCAELIHDDILETLSEKYLFENYRKPLLIPVPLHAKRLRARGYNQSELIARALCALAPETFTLNTTALAKTKETRSQTEIQNKEERKRNIRGAFAVAKPEDVRGRHVILIDDVTTTGATIREARAVLKKSGAKTVHAYTIAH